MADSPAGMVELDKGGVRAVRYSLAPGATIPGRADVLVALGPGRLAGVSQKNVPRTVTAPGFVCVEGKSDNPISNAGNHPIDVLQFQLIP